MFKFTGAKQAEGQVSQEQEAEHGVTVVLKENSVEYSRSILIV